MNEGTRNAYMLEQEIEIHFHAVEDRNQCFNMYVSKYRPYQQYRCIYKNDSF